MDWRLFAGLGSVAASAGLLGWAIVGLLGSSPDPAAAAKTSASGPMLMTERRGDLAAAPAPWTAGNQLPGTSSIAPPPPPPAPPPPVSEAPRVERPKPPRPAPERHDVAVSSVPKSTPPKPPAASIEHRIAAAKPVSKPRPEPNTVVALAKPEVSKAPEPVVASPPPAKAKPLPPPRDPRYDGVLTIAEIARIKASLRLTADQLQHWPPVEGALREMGRQQIAQVKAGHKPEISPDDWPPQKIYWIAGNFINSLRPEQKEQVRRLARQLGFQSVASMI